MSGRKKTIRKCPFGFLVVLFTTGAMFVLFAAPRDTGAAQDDAYPINVKTEVVDYALATVDLALAEYDKALSVLHERETEAAQAKVRYARARLIGAVNQLVDAARGKRISTLDENTSRTSAVEQAQAARHHVDNARKTEAPAEQVKLLELRLRVADLRLDAIDKNK